ncbi:MAG: hypothetical protein J0H55_15420 [Chitinophagaceae bacterium]|nr:hypothetical protein [Chitinophagaceae bacterium]
MKKTYIILIAGFLAILTSCTTNKNFAQSYYEPPSDGVTYQQFYDELSPYGNWFNYPGYGYVWAPYETGFRPYYSNGHWIYTQVGWTWVSGYNWGWAPFHYGRWMFEPAYGWLWVPGYQWAPAWVAWRGGGGYYGWAPLGVGMSINISFGAIPAANWFFVPSRYINSPRMGHYFVNRSYNKTIINNTTIINNYYGDSRNRYYSGPRVMDVERQTNQRIAPVRIVDRNTPGNPELTRNQIAMYRPAVRQSDNSNIRPANVATAPIREFNRPQQNNGNEFQNNGIDMGSGRNQSQQTVDRSAVNPTDANKREFQETQNNRSLQTPVNPEQVQRSNNLPRREFTPANDGVYNNSQRNNPEVRPMQSVPQRQMEPQSNRSAQIPGNPVQVQPGNNLPKREFTPADDGSYNNWRRNNPELRQMGPVPQRQMKPQNNQEEKQVERMERQPQRQPQRISEPRVMRQETRQAIRQERTLEKKSADRPARKF